MAGRASPLGLLTSYVTVYRSFVKSSPGHGLIHHFEMIALAPE
jgi:hypothetical protein